IKVSSCGLAECIQEAAQRIGWENRQNLGADRGIGVAALMHVGGGARIYKSDGCGAVVKVDEAGGVTVLSGATELGQGGDTVQAQIAAEVMGVPIEDITVVNQDTAIKLWDVGAHASRSTFIAGNAVRIAAQKAREQLLAIAARKLEARAEDLEIKDGKVFVKGSPDRYMTVGQVVRYGLLRAGGDVVVASHFYAPPTEDMNEEFKGNLTAALAFGCQAVEVQVDRKTGRVDVKKVVAAHDLGRAINPMAAEGQIEGGVAMGLGFATTEELIVKDGVIQNTTLLDYRIPTVADVPGVEAVLVESIDPEGPFGAKGLGETSTVPLAAAIANAVYQATGVRIKELPITPERILRALEDR
ncbi:MAG: molybdopterin-dependent oxidoreductase, partial [Chloroflexi bacterium]|nr:molybdopterin-dependent oxidoreductase [Chloroflexota bacterium]